MSFYIIKGLCSAENRNFPENGGNFPENIFQKSVFRTHALHATKGGTGCSAKYWSTRFVRQDWMESKLAQEDPFTRRNLGCVTKCPHQWKKIMTAFMALPH